MISPAQRQTVILLIFGIIIGLLPGIVFHYSFLGTIVVPPQRCQKAYPFTSQSLDCTEFNDSVERMKSVDKKLETVATRLVKDGKAEHISIWTRDLISRQWAGYDEFETYAPASLMKVPLMIAYFKFAQIQPSILDEQLVYTPAKELGDNMQNFMSATLMQTGQKYSVERLIEEMIENSDNNSADILASRMDPQFMNTVLIELGIRIPKGSNEFNFLTAKTYANIFRILYNASYLDRTYSEKALELMSKSAFKGIEEPLPSSVQVAHKFGEREMNNPDGSVKVRELHDCGIVYKQPHPYSLCIMTKGQNFDDLLTSIKTVSKTVYDAM